MRAPLHPVLLGLTLALLGGNVVSAHQRLPDSREWTDFRTASVEGAFILRRRVHATTPIKLRLNFQPELQKSADDL